MSRIQIIFPEEVIFSTQIPVRITDLNYGAHLGNDSMLALMHEARVQLLAFYGYTELNVESSAIIMADAAILFKAEAFYGDLLTFEIAIADFTRVSFDIYYRVKCGDKLIAIAKTGTVFYNYQDKKVVPVPAQFQNKIQK